MKISLHKLNNCRESLKKLGALELSISLSYEIYKVMKEIEPQLSYFDTQLRAIYDAHLEKDTDGNFKLLNQKDSQGLYQIIPGQEKALYSKLSELDNLEADINITKISVTEILNSGGKLSASDFQALDFLFE